MVEKVASIDPSFKQSLADEVANPSNKPMPGD
jgi:hypothetical protein